MSKILDQAVQITANGLNKDLNTALTDGSLVPSVVDTSVVVPVITDWQAYTPTFTAFGSVTNVEFLWRQVGSNVEVRGKFVTGTPTSGEARVTLPNSYISADTSKIPSLQLVGKMARGTTGGDNYAVLIEPSTGYFVFGVGYSAGTELTKTTGFNMTVSGTTHSFEASIAVSGLSATTTKNIKLTQSGLIQEVDTTIRMTGAVRGTTSTGVYNFTTIQSTVGSGIIVSSSTTLGTTFTAVDAGQYAISFSAPGGTASSVAAGLSRNQSSSGTTSAENLLPSEILAVARDTDTAGGAGKFPSVSWSGYLNAGDILRCHGNTSDVALGSNSVVTVTKFASLKQVQVNANQKATIPTHELRFEGASGTGSTATSIIKFNTLAKLVGSGFTIVNDAVNGTAITITKAGLLSVSASACPNAAGNGIFITKNQSVLTANPAQTEVLADSFQNGTGNYTSNAATTVSVNVGDIIRVAASGALAATAGREVFALVLQEQQVQVSVSNTLPQFSDSDLVVKAAGNAGQSVTASVTDIPFITVSDTTSGAWSGSAFTVPSDGTYTLSGCAYYSTVAARSLYLYVNGTQYKILSDNAGASTNTNPFSITDKFTAGQVITLRCAQTATLINNSVIHFINITKIGKPNVTGVDVTPFVNIPQYDQEYVRLSGNGGYGSTSTGVMRFSTVGQNTNKGILKYITDAVNGDYLQAVKRCKVSGSVGMSVPAGAPYGWVGVFDSLTTQVSASGGPGTASYTLASNQFPGVASGTQVYTIPFDGILEAGQILRAGTSTQSVTASYLTVTADALSDTILTAPQTFSLDTANLQWSSTYTSATLPSAPVGTLISFTGGASAQATTQCNTAPTQAANTFNQGLLLTSKVFTAAGSNNTPCRFDIQIGKGLKGVKIDAYSGLGRTGNSVNMDFFTSGAGIDIGTYTAYNENTGVLTVNAGFAWSSNGTRYLGTLVDGTTTTSAYIFISASTNPALTGMNVVIPRIATISHQLASGNHGGTATSGAYATRPLNTIDDPSGIVTSLASNQFTLPAGDYYITANASAIRVDSNKIKIRNITDSLDAIIGIPSYSPGSTDGTANTFVSGRISIASPKVFELQHRVTTTRATDGFGEAASYGDNEVFAIIKIQKVK